MRAEIEAALVVVTSDPAAVFARLRKLRTLGPYRLEPRSTQHLCDRYLDTASRDLWRRRLAVRQRYVDGECLLALKGDLGPRERLEIESPDDGSGRQRIGGELRRRGVADGLAGLEVIQERETTRERRALSSSGHTIAELALDEVVYRLGGQDVRLHEVEAELEDRDADLDPVVAELRRAAPELREWPFNKLATGAGIAAALEDGELGLAPAGILPPDAFDRLAHRLTSDQG